MVKVNRTAWEREGIFDNLLRLGVAVMPRHKFVALGEQSNWSPNVLKTWLEHWKEFINDQDQDFNILQVGETILMWRSAPGRVPQLISKLIKTTK